MRDLQRLKPDLGSSVPFAGVDGGRLPTLVAVEPEAESLHDQQRRHLSKLALVDVPQGPLQRRLYVG
jgi:hypothetical protein